MKRICIKLIVCLLIYTIYNPCMAQDNLRDRLVSCISLNGEQAICQLEKNLVTAKIPFLMKDDALFTHFIWLKEYDEVVNILKEKSYSEGPIGVAKLYLDIGKYKKGIAILESEIENGNSNAYVALGMEYRRGRAFPINNSKSFYLYNKVKEMGNMDGYFYLGRCYENGIGVKKDCRKAVELFEEAARNGHKLSVYRLIEYYKKGACGIPKDPYKLKCLLRQMR